MFDMDDEDVGILEEPASPRQTPVDPTLDRLSRPPTPTASKDVWHECQGQRVLKHGQAPCDESDTSLINSYSNVSTNDYRTI